MGPKKENKTGKNWRQMQETFESQSVSKKRDANSEAGVGLARNLTDVMSPTKSITP